MSDYGEGYKDGYKEGFLDGQMCKRKEQEILDLVKSKNKLVEGYE
ncbi:TPA_asm: hypothetical protein CBHJFHIM_00025 [Methanobrevibacter gottschalkii virus vir075]|uniref:Uncharacterized protein n=1 Tax=Methanobrevibacter gottschalkii TaxID=190974 RepID=A0A1H7I6G9_9EURY|nr:hypothetical protein [Methanobrevibacter gottschalkii]SEK58129.1 hypothetical protein SAMN05216439_1159 [Methanobrevibacter gottschalkii]